MSRYPSMDPRDPDFWRVSEDEPGAAYTMVTLVIFVVGIAGLVALAWLWAPMGAGYPS